MKNEANGTPVSFDPWAVDYDKPGRLELNDRYGRPWIGAGEKRVTLIIHSTDSKAWAKANNFILNRRLTQQAGQRGSRRAEDLTEDNNDLYARAIGGWEGMPDVGNPDKEMEFTPKNARRVVSDLVFVREQIEEFQRDRANFT